MLPGELRWFMQGGFSTSLVYERTGPVKSGRVALRARYQTINLYLYLPLPFTPDRGSTSCREYVGLSSKLCVHTPSSKSR